MFKKSIILAGVCTALATNYPALAQDSSEYDQGLSASEIQLIEAKKDALLYLLMEKGELEPLLRELTQQEREAIADREIDAQQKYTPEQIIRARQNRLVSESAANRPIEKQQVMISEEDYNPNGFSPIIVHVAANNPSSLSFFDYQGNPWPLAGDVIGNSNAYESKAFGEAKNTAVFTIKERFVETTALIALQGINQLVTVKLIGNESGFDLKKNIRIPQIGPNSKESLTPVTQSVSNSDPILIKMLNGEEVTGGQKYKSTWDSDSVFVRVENALYVRTKEEITFPPSLTYQKSSNGYNLYKLDFSNAVTMKKDGRYQVVPISPVTRGVQR